MNEGKSTVDKRVPQLKGGHKGITPHGAAMTPDQRKIKKLEKKIKQTELEKEILKKATDALDVRLKVNAEHEKMPWGVMTTLR